MEKNNICFRQFQAVEEERKQWSDLALVKEGVSEMSQSLH